MRFGGHETFAVREGWLHKGLKLLLETPERLGDPYVADWLGVGRNMAKSIKHWLLATGLAERSIEHGTEKQTGLRLSPLGKLVYARDPDFLERGTWWALHVNLVNTPEHAMTWWWFFNHWSQVRFERGTCQEALRRHLELHEKRVPGLRTLQRDVACLLSTYAREIPPTRTDPEDATESPFRELGLLSYFPASAVFRRNAMQSHDVPPELVGYALVLAARHLPGQGTFAEMTVRDACFEKGGPGRCFQMDLETLHQVCLEAGSNLGGDRFNVTTFAGERVIQFASKPKEEWLLEYYDKVAADRREAA